MKHATKKILAIVFLAMFPICPLVSGCGMLITEIDTDAAIQAAATVNVENIRTIIEIKSTEHLDAAQSLDKSLTEKLRASSGGDEAVEILEAYRKTRDRVEAFARLEMSQYKKALGNAMLMSDLSGRRIGLRARYYAMLGRIPAIRTIRDAAEHAARRYVETIGQPEPADIIRDPGQ